MMKITNNKNQIPTKNKSHPPTADSF